MNCPLEKTDITVEPIEPGMCDDCDELGTHLIWADLRAAGERIVLGGIRCRIHAESHAEDIRAHLPGEGDLEAEVERLRSELHKEMTANSAAQDQVRDLKAKVQALELDISELSMRAPRLGPTLEEEKASARPPRRRR